MICCCCYFFVFSELSIATVLAPGLRGAWEQRTSLWGRRRGCCDGDEAERKPSAVQLCSSATLNTLPPYSRSTGMSTDLEFFFFSHPFKAYVSWESLSSVADFCCISFLSFFIYLFLFYFYLVLLHL